MNVAWAWNFLQLLGLTQIGCPTFVVEITRDCGGAIAVCLGVMGERETMDTGLTREFACRRVVI